MIEKFFFFNEEFPMMNWLGEKGRLKIEAHSKRRRRFPVVGGFCFLQFNRQTQVQFAQLDESGCLWLVVFAYLVDQKQLYFSISEAKVFLSTWMEARTKRNMIRTKHSDFLRFSFLSISLSLFKSERVELIFLLWFVCSLFKPLSFPAKTRGTG